MATRSSKSAEGSRISDTRKERLMDIQKREQLKGMLINKFKLKYGDKPQISKFIDNEVTRYLKNDRLTEDSLRNLDGKISKEAGLRDRKEQILDDRKSNHSAHRSQTANQIKPADTQSVRSSARSIKSATRKPADAMSVASS